MNAVSSVEITYLEAQVNERQEFLNKALEFLEMLLPKLGKRTHYYQGSSHTNEKWELKNFHQFSFYGDFCHTMYGGYDIKVWWSPDPARQIDESKDLVLEIYWQTSHNECEVKQYKADSGWQSALLKLAESKSALFEEKEAADGKLLSEREQAEKEARKLAELRKRAVKLALVR
jgi:hypothetical protein